MRCLLAGAVALIVFASAPAQDAPLTLERVMADPDWIAGFIDAPGTHGEHGNPPYFSVDGRAVYYQVKRAGSPIRDLHRIDLGDNRDSIVDGAAMATADGGQLAFDQAHTHAAFVRNGDVFLREVATGRLTQVTRTSQDESAPQFSADGRLLSYRQGNDWFVYDIASGVGGPAAVLKTEKDPDAPPAKADDLHDLQLRLFSTLRQARDDKHAVREHGEALQRADASRAPLPFYLGDEVQISGTALSPDARVLLVATTPKKHDEGKKGKLTRYVTESGYEEFEDERIRVGRNDPAPQTLWRFDLAAHTQTQIGYDTLPGIHDDPLKAVREENATQAKAREKARQEEAKNIAEEKDKPAHGAAGAKPAHADAKAAASAQSEGAGKERPIEVVAMRFSADARNAAVELRAFDNKDRWIATIEDGKLAVQHRLHDDAWINWNFNEFGWMHDNRSLWYVSEENGFAHLYTKAPGAKAHALTQGRFEVSHPHQTRDGRWFYLRANVDAPHTYDLYRVAATGGELQRVTRDGGIGSFDLSPDEQRVLVVRSSSYLPAQLALVAADGSGPAHDLTDTRTAEYKAMHWVAPQFVQVPSTHFKGSIWAKFYGPAAGQDDAAAAPKRPAVIFVHGAGYTQNVHEQFPYYFREQMFHNLLLQKGYVVLDMDYRASEGYGREWRVAIYRNMGHPELEDLLDGKRWLVEQHHVDPKRVGIYGGSYGGYMTLMALFRAPGEFAAGAALRPVADWTQYNHEYTSDILNDPQVDPIAYARSSPIEFADGLADPLLICHGIIDDNVLFEDSARLYERLIELHKDNFTLSPYPLDRHGFTNADSWLDEYKRIYKLFDANLR